MLQIKNTLGGGKPEGLYAWKKYERQYNLKTIATEQSVYVITNSITTLYYSDNYSVSENGEVVLENPQSISWTATAYPSSSLKDEIANALKGHYVIVGEYKSNYTRYEVLAAASGKNVCFIPSTATAGSISGAVPFENVATIYNGEIIDAFLDYIVSDKETAYPDGGEKDGYWYEKVADILGLLGCTKISVETFIPTSNISVGYGTYTLNHGLGEIPKYAILLSEGATANNTLTRMLWMYIGRSGDYQTSMYEYLGSSGMTSLGVYRNSKSKNSTSTYITIGTDGAGEKLMAGVEYTLITMA